jgi:hypothetical protein
MFAAMAYFIFKIYRIYDDSQAEKYRYVREFLTFFGKISITNLRFFFFNLPLFHSKRIFGTRCIDHY